MDTARRIPHFPPLPSKNAGGTLVGILVGLILGATLTAGAAWYFTQVNPFHAAPAAPHPPATTNQPSALPGKPGDRPVEKPDFDLYKILPEGGHSPSPASPPPPRTAAAPPPAEKSWLQLGAFENPAEADNLKAQIALMGIESILQRGQLADGRTIHRVRVGPFSNATTMSAVRDRLTSAGFTTTVTRAGQ
jgi:cell division protein FtsN